MQPASRPRRQSPTRQYLAWSLIGFGLLRQFLMISTGQNCMRIFLDPPGRICPWASVSFLWWFVLTMGAAMMYILKAANRMEGIPTRVVNPFYLYLIFLLIFVKPV